MDAYDKVTGRARYAGDLASEGALRLSLILSSVCSGRVRHIDTARAMSLPGVVGVMTHVNAPRLASLDCLTLLQNAAVLHAGQPVVAVAATSIARARRAAALVTVDIERFDDVSADFSNPRADAIEPVDVLDQPPSSIRGNPVSVLEEGGSIRIDETYTTPMHLHSPLEPHTVTARWIGGEVVVHTATSGIFAARSVIARAFSVAPERVRVLSPLQGGGFCAKGSAWWPCLLLAVSAAKLYERPVRLDLTREQMFTVVGNRQRTVQRLAAATDQAGRLTALCHEIVSETGRVRNYSEPTGFPTRSVYCCPNVAVRHRVVATSTPQPLPMRGPGEAPGSFALESALDELAVRLAVDPVELRLRNWADRDQHANLPWSSNSLRECLRVGAEAFGWERRGPVGSMRDGVERVGWGVASSYYPGFRAPSAARVRLDDRGTITLECGNQEIGTGACTVMAQATADLLNVRADALQVRFGDSVLPETPMAAGAMSTASVVPAVEAAAKALQRKVIGLAIADPQSPLFRCAADQIAWESPSRISANQLSDDPLEVLSRAGLTSIDADGRNEAVVSSHSVNTFGACFAEVRVDGDLGEIRVSRLVGAYAAGRIMNARLARSQLIGGLVFGVGMALHEKAVVHRASGLVSNRSLVDYLLSVHADVPDIEVHLVEEVDPYVPSGVKGLGMNGTVGTAAAIANAVYHATGIRVRDLPIEPLALVRR